MDYECPECNMTASDEAWDEQTEEFYGDNITSINKAYRTQKTGVEELFFVCPHCFETDVSIYDIKRVES